jgi:dTDP-4-amino-4,6-dideoxygalactose transaminase
MIKVLIPDLPSPQAILPYLEEMHNSAQYVNDCPLVQRFEGALSEITGYPVAVVSNGTVALELALRALELPPRSLVLVPSVTYVASGQAIRNAGLTPVLADVDPMTWLLTPEYAANTVRDLDIRAVMPVAAFGARLPLREWARFQGETDVKVIVDGAGSLYSQQEQVPIPICYSLHATKFLGVGEGGFVTGPGDFVKKVHSLANFGPYGTNGKMSGFHAAVGLAALADEFQLATKRIATFVQEAAYRNSLPPWVGQQQASIIGRTVMPILVPRRRDLIEAALLEAGIETKRWYCPLLHEREEFDCDLLPLVHARIIGEHLIGLPFHSQLKATDVQHICDTLRRFP